MKKAVLVEDLEALGFVVDENKEGERTHSGVNASIPLPYYYLRVCRFHDLLEPLEEKELIRIMKGFLRAGATIEVAVEAICERFGKSKELLDSCPTSRDELDRIMEERPKKEKPQPKLPNPLNRGLPFEYVESEMVLRDRINDIISYLEWVGGRLK